MFFQFSFEIQKKIIKEQIHTSDGMGGVLLTLFDVIGTDPELQPYFVEIGTEYGRECNSRVLRLERGWRNIF